MKTLRGYKIPKLSDAQIRILVNGKEIIPGVENVLNDWAEVSAVAISAELRSDIDQARKECDLPADSRLGLYVSARSSGTGLRIISPVIELAAEAAEAVVAFSPHSAGGTISIRAYLVVIEAGAVASNLAPSNNDILADWQASVHLEGDGNRASVYFKEFEASQKHSLWEIELSCPTDDDEWLNRATNSVVSVALNKTFYLKNWDIKYSPFFLRVDYLWSVVEIFIDEPNYVDTVFVNVKEAPGSFIKYCHSLLGWLLETDDRELIKRLLRDKNWLRSQVQSKLAKQIGL